jgi:hypothetical protein
MPSVVVLDADGNRLRSFQPQPAALGGTGPCASILKISWASAERTIGVECHVNPSLSEYVEVDPFTGETLRDLAGYWFTPSIPENHVAYVGPIIHFAPPYRQSNYLLIDGMTTYPLPEGVRPRVEKVMDSSIDVVRQSLWVFTPSYPDFPGRPIRRGSPSSIAFPTGSKREATPVVAPSGNGSITNARSPLLRSTARSPYLRFRQTYSSTGPIQRSAYACYGGTTI